MGLGVPAGQGTHTHPERKKRKRRRLQQCYTLCPGDASAWLEETRVEIQVCPALGVRLWLCWARFGKRLCFGEAFRQLAYSRKPWEQEEPCLCFLLLPAGALPCLLCVSSGHSSPPAPLCASCTTALVSLVSAPLLSCQAASGAQLGEGAGDTAGCRNRVPAGPWGAVHSSASSSERLAALSCAWGVVECALRIPFQASGL